MDLFEHYGLTRIINANGKMTALCGAIVASEAIALASEAMHHFFDLDEIQRLAGRKIAELSGADDGCITACSSAGISVSVAACMTGADLAKVHRLPDTDEMPNRVVIQRGHCVDYGAPLLQAIRLTGARPAEIGTINRCTESELGYELGRGRVACVVAVESHHTVQHGQLDLNTVVRLAHEHDVPVVVDGAAQDLRLRELIETGADLVVASAHKYLSAPTAGIVCGQRDLIEAVLMQNRGIGRGMKAGKEAIFGTIAVIEKRLAAGIDGWRAAQERRIALILERLTGIDGLALSVDADPNGNPFRRVRLTPDAAVCGCTAAKLAQTLAEGSPRIVMRSHHAEEGYLNFDAIELTDVEIEHTCARIRDLLGGMP